MQAEFTGNIDEILAIERIDGSHSLLIRGWLLNPAGSYATLDVGLSGSTPRRARRQERADLAAILQGVPHAAGCGFSVRLETGARLPASIELCFEAKSETGQILRTSLVSSVRRADLYIPELQHDFTQGCSRELLYSQLRAELEDFLVNSEKFEFAPCSTPRLSVILVLHNRAELTLACLRTLRRELEDEAAEVIVIDNASSDDSGALLRRVGGLTVHRNAKNEHFIAAANLGASLAHGAYLLFLNNDTLLPCGTLSNAMARVKEDSSIGALGARLVHPEGMLQEAGSIVLRDGSAHAYGRGAAPSDPEFLVAHETDFCSGAFLLTGRELFAALGGFDAAFSPAYYEDVDYCFKLRRHGKRVVYEPKVTLIHCEMASSTSNAQAQDLMTRNRGIFLKHHEQELTARLTRRGSRPSLHAKRLLLIDDFVPRAAIGQGAPRAVALLNGLLKLDFEVDILATNETRGGMRSDFPGLPPEVRSVDFCPRLELPSYFTRRKDLAYEVLLVSRPHNLQSVQWLRTNSGPLRPSLPLLYDAEAIFCRRQIRQREVREKMSISADERWMIEAMEMEVARGVDAIMCVSEQERAAYEDYGYDRAFLLGHGIDLVESPADFESRSGILMVGPTLDVLSPNSDAVTWFVQSSLPLIETLRRDRSIVFTLAGECTARSVLELRGPQVLVMGHQSDLRQLYARHKLFVAPMRYSTGIALKVVEAAAHGLPVVATGLVADQLAWRPEQELLVADSAAEFAQQCDRLLQDTALWGKIRANAMHRVQVEFSQRRFMQDLSKVLCAVGLRPNLNALLL